jgi:hypothetical protein
MSPSQATLQPIDVMEGGKIKQIHGLAGSMQLPPTEMVWAACSCRWACLAAIVAWCMDSYQWQKCLESKHINKNTTGPFPSLLLTAESTRGVVLSNTKCAWNPTNLQQHGKELPKDLGVKGVGRSHTDEGWMLKESHTYEKRLT